MGLSDHAPILATLSVADDESTTARLLNALGALIDAADQIPEPAAIRIPERPRARNRQPAPRRLLQPVRGRKATDAAGRIAAEQITPYPPGIPVSVPGERITQPVVDYLLTGLQAGMLVPDPPTPVCRRSE